jgi:hypothetical protein
VAVIVAPLWISTAPVALKTTIPPLVPFQSLAVSVPPLEMVTFVHCGTRCTTTFWFAKLAPS